MANLIVLTFDDTEQAIQALETLKKVQSGGYLKLNDAAVIVKDATGKVEIKNQVSSGTLGGALGGSFLGLLIAGVFFPLAGLAIGAIGGALVGKSLHKGVDQDFVKDVTEQLKPGSSALFVMVRSSDPDIAIAALRPYKGKVYQTTLPSDAEEQLQDALKKKE
jgi:uncharacterized membrane protein